MFNKLQGVLLGQDVIEMLAGDFEILHNLKGFFKNLPPPSYEMYNNIDDMVRNMTKDDYPMCKAWHHMCQLLKIYSGRKGESSNTR
jgi:hypothetical protein